MTLPLQAQTALLQDAIQRDRTTARRAALLRILWQERYLPRENLVARVEGCLGKGCFGSSAWEDTFYRDMSVVKKALRSAGYCVLYRRGFNRPGYYLQGQPKLGNDISVVLDGSVTEVDKQQIRILSDMSPADHFRLGCSISDTARHVVEYRRQQMNPYPSQAASSQLSQSHEEMDESW